MKFVIFITSIILFFESSISEKENTSVIAEDICVNEDEMRLYNLIMAYRKSKNLKIIPLSAKLTKVAQTHTRDLSENYKIDSRNKCNPHSWSKKGKWTSCCYTNDHKQATCMWDKPNEIAGYNSPGYEIAYYSSLGAKAQEGLDGWKLSSAHNPLLINEGMWSKIEWNAIGVGIYKEYAVVWFGQIKDAVQPNDCKK